MAKLIIIRGNSGSGKSTVAKLLRDKLSEKVALIEQDYLRRIVLGEKEKESGDNIVLIEQVVSFALGKNYTVILEGILNSHRYGAMLQRLMSTAMASHVCYMDVSLDETLKRHKTKHNAHEFGERELKRWYKEKDVLGCGGEVMIKESQNAEDVVAMVVAQISA